MIVAGAYHCPEGRESRIRRGGGTTASCVTIKRGLSRRQFVGALQYRHAIVRAVKTTGVWSALPRNPIGIANCGPEPSLHDHSVIRFGDGSRGFPMRNRTSAIERLV